MSALVGFATGAALTAVLLLVTRGVFARRVFAATNFRGRQLPVGVGVLCAGAVGAGVALLAVVHSRVADLALPRLAGITVVVVACAFSGLGLYDDLFAQGTARGFRGHLQALARGRVTTGAVKLIGGGVVALLVSAAVGRGGPLVVALDAAVIALGANTANLFDRAPGRLGKLSLLCGAAVVLLAGDGAALTAVSVLLGAVAALLPGDLRERFMLGDAGSNPIGAVLATGVVLATAVPVHIVVLVVLVALNVLGEKVSFSAVIAQNRVLRTMDRAGRLSER